MRPAITSGAAAPSLAAPARSTNDTARGANAGRIGEQGTNESPEFGRCAPDAQEPDQGRLATLKARAARAGCALHELAGGGYLLCQWNLSRELPDLRAVDALLRRMGGAA